MRLKSSTDSIFSMRLLNLYHIKNSPRSKYSRQTTFWVEVNPHPLKRTSARRKSQTCPHIDLEILSATATKSYTWPLTISTAQMSRQ